MEEKVIHKVPLCSSEKDVIGKIQTRRNTQKTILFGMFTKDKVIGIPMEYRVDIHELKFVDYDDIFNDLLIKKYHDFHWYTRTIPTNTGSINIMSVKRDSETFIIYRIDEKQWSKTTIVEEKIEDETKN